MREEGRRGRHRREGEETERKGEDGADANTSIRMKERDKQGYPFDKKGDCNLITSHYLLLCESFLLRLSLFSLLASPFFFFFFFLFFLPSSFSLYFTLFYPILSYFIEKRGKGEGERGRAEAKTDRIVCFSHLTFL